MFNPCVCGWGGGLPAVQWDSLSTATSSRDHLGAAPAHCDRIFQEVERLDRHRISTLKSIMQDYLQCRVDSFRGMITVCACVLVCLCVCVCVCVAYSSTHADTQMLRY